MVRFQIQENHASHGWIDYGAYYPADKLEKALADIDESAQKSPGAQFRLVCRHEVVLFVHESIFDLR